MLINSLCYFGWSVQHSILDISNENGKRCRVLVQCFINCLPHMFRVVAVFFNAGMIVLLNTFAEFISNLIAKFIITRP